VKALSGTFTTYDTTNTASTRTTGTDASVRINGIQAVSDGLNVSLSTSTLDLGFDLISGVAAGSSFSFSLTGGGALFQIGPDVVSNQQARMGIGSVNSSRLSGTAGRLDELKSGGSKSLTGDVTGAGKVVNQAITTVATLRGRLGAFQKTTLDTNIATLTDTLQNLTDAESSIRDADFAKETANLTRAQILSQSGLTVLKLANQSPQQVLSLLQ
jgi:flagellin-like hook-associated protein FlgL